jgi:hypothetical protein
MTDPLLCAVRPLGNVLFAHVLDSAHTEVLPEPPPVVPGPPSLRWAIATVYDPGATLLSYAAASLFILAVCRRGQFALAALPTTTSPISAPGDIITIDTHRPGQHSLPGLEDL